MLTEWLITSLKVTVLIWVGVVFRYYKSVSWDVKIVMHKFRTPSKGGLRQSRVSLMRIFILMSLFAIRLQYHHHLSVLLNLWERTTGARDLLERCLHVIAFNVGVDSIG